MNNFNRDKARGSFRGDKPQMHETVCSDCGKRCEVPFKPTNQKPVYCRECFRNHGGDKGKFERSSNRRETSFGGRNTDVLKKDNQYKEQLDQLIAKLDIIINMLATKEQDKEIAKKPKKPLKKKPTSKKK